MRNFGKIEVAIFQIDTDFFLDILDKVKIVKNQEYLAKELTWAADIIYYSMDEDNFSKMFTTYTRRYSSDWDLNPGLTPAVLTIIYIA